MNISSKLALALPLAWALSLPVAAADAAPADAATADTSSGVAIDRETGRLRAPTAEERAELARDGERLRQQRVFQRRSLFEAPRPATEAEAAQTVVVHADGSVMAEVPESLDSQLAVRRDANGQLVFEHRGAAEGHDHD
jgi:hypothetical protein